MYAHNDKIYYRDDHSWDRIKKLITNKNIIALTADYTQKHAMLRLSEILRKNNIPLSVLDVSNVKEHLSVHGGTMSGIISPF